MPEFHLDGCRITLQYTGYTMTLCAWSHENLCLGLMLSDESYGSSSREREKLRLGFTVSKSNSVCLYASFRCSSWSRRMCYWCRCKLSWVGSSALCWCPKVSFLYLPVFFFIIGWFFINFALCTQSHSFLLYLPFHPCNPPQTKQTNKDKSMSPWKLWYVIVCHTVLLCHNSFTCKCS